ncbi:mitosis inhibitor protein kinase SWE1, partial [Tremellales sp. Uapishka_1]
MATTSPTPIPTQFSPIPTRPNTIYSRSPKRAKADPSPLGPPPSAGPSRPRSRLPTSTHPRRDVQESRHAMTSPVRSPDTWQDRAARRREMSVPLLSQTLSHFSLSQSPPIPLPNRATLSDSPSIMASTPRRPSHTTPSRTPLPPHHVYPSTAPLPEIPSFLGSPFSSRTARGRYVYGGGMSSPGSGLPLATMTERIPYSETADVGAWMGRAEWMDDLPQPEIDDQDHDGDRRRNVRSSISASSIEDFSASGASSSSLRSLARSSGEHYNRPNIVTIWDEDEMAISGRLEEEDEDPSTPSRQLFSQESILQMSTKTARPSPGLSPLNSKSTYHTQVSPLQSFLHSKARIESPQPSPSPHKPTRSPLANLLPRLISSSKKALRHKSKSRSRDPGPDEEEVMTDTEDASFGFIRSNTIGRANPLSPMRNESSLPGGGIGLGIQATSTRLCDRSISLSSESSGEIDPSPTRAPTAKVSHTKLQPFPTPAPSSPSPHHVASNKYRRKTVSSQVSAKPLQKTPGAASMRVPAARPSLRRGISEGRAVDEPKTVSTGGLVYTPTALFGDEKPSPAAFASTGLMKKRGGSVGMDVPHFGEGQPHRRWTMLGSHREVSRGKDLHKALTEVQAKKELPKISTLPKSRGLRRKGSTLFNTSGSTGSIGSASEWGIVEMASPATPKKPDGLQGIPTSETIVSLVCKLIILVGEAPLRLGITTPSPTAMTTTSMYPFTSSQSISTLSTSPQLAIRAPRNRHLHDPVARNSNPMLAATFKAHESLPRKGDRGNRFDKDFVLIESLGGGAFSKVWKVRDKKGGVWAVKAGKPYSGSKNRMRQLEEASILRQLSLFSHPNVIHFVDSWEQSNRLYIRTGLAECGDLSKFLNLLGDSGGLGEARVWKVLNELCSGLSFIHSKGFLHLDIKPSNILITAGGGLKIADFGMSIILQDDGEGGGLSPALPEEGPDGGFVWSETEHQVASPLLDRELEGDREYLCPEALNRHDGKIGKQADVFSLGILVLESALNVDLPSNGESWIKLRQDDFSDLEEHYSTARTDGRPCLSVEMMRLIKGLMASDPEKRITLCEVEEMEVVERIRERGGGRMALVQEDEGWLSSMLAQD